MRFLYGMRCGRQLRLIAAVDQHEHVVPAQAGDPASLGKGTAWIPANPAPARGYRGAGMTEFFGASEARRYFTGPILRFQSSQGRMMVSDWTGTQSSASSGTR